MSEQQDNFLYKYCSAERLAVLENLQLRFTQLHELNDPFECRFALDPLEREKEKAKIDNYSAERAEVEVFLSSRMSTLGVLCLSRVPDNPVMWAHYASEQRGFVLGIRQDQNPFAGSAFMLDDFSNEVDLTSIPGFGSFREVTYSSELIRIAIGESVPWDAFFRKAPQWSYEQEVRIFRSVWDAHTKIGSKGREVYLFEIPIRSLQRVIIGAKAEVKVERAAKVLSERAELAHVRFERAVLNYRNRQVCFEPLS